MPEFRSKTFALLNSKKVLIGLFLIAPFLTYFEVIFLSYTISFNEASTDFSKRFGKMLPVVDPAAGSQQDHPWLFKIGMALRQGEIPFINLDNGLGAFLLESLQSGVLYPPNLLLPVMDLSSSQFFDLFQVLHILILAIGSFLLFRLYIRWELALILACAFSLSFLTFFNINMVHFRAFVWTPFMAWAAVCIARGNYSIRVILTAAGAAICSITAGNPQESFFNLIAVVILFAAEVLQSKRINWKKLTIFGLSFGGGILIATPAVLPYLIGKREGWIQSVESTVRSSFSISPQWLLSWLIPYINGPHQAYYRPSISSNFEYATFPIHPLLLFLTIAGLNILILNIRILNLRKSNPYPNQFVFLVTLVTGILGIINISSFSLFQKIVATLPFVNTIQLTKYINYIHLLIAVSAVIALSWLVKMPLLHRRRVTALALAVSTGLVLLIVLFQITDPAWKLKFDQFDQVLLAWIGSVLAIAACVLFLVTDSARPRWNVFMGLLLLASLGLKPFGFFKALQPYSPFPIAGLDFAQERILSNADTPNTNLLRKYERLEVFDPILNQTFATFMSSNLSVLSGSLHLQIPPNQVIKAKQIPLLRFMGVTSIYGYTVEENEQTSRIQESFIRVKDPLPKIFVIKDASAIAASCQAKNYAQTVELIRAGIVSQPINGVQKGVNDLRFTFDRPGSGTLVSLQAFSPGWELDGRSATPFCTVFNAWKGDFQANQPYQLTYTPPGLRKSYTLVFAGILLMLGAIALSSRTRRSIQEFELDN